MRRLTSPGDRTEAAYARRRWPSRGTRQQSMTGGRFGPSRPKATPPDGSRRFPGIGGGPRKGRASHRRRQWSEGQRRRCCALLALLLSEASPDLAESEPSELTQQPWNMRIASEQADLHELQLRSLSRISEQVGKLWQR